MSAVDSPNLNDDGSPILYPYKSNPNARRHRRSAKWTLAALGLFCLFWGMVFAFMAPVLILVWMAPIGILMLAAIWALPDQRTAPTGAVQALFISFTLVLGLWPDYLSISLHQFGLPWVSFERLISLTLGLTFLICVSVSAKLRSEIAESLGAQPAVWMLLVGFVVVQTYCMVLTPYPVQGMDRYVNMQTTWTLMFFVGAWIFARDGLVEKWTKSLWLTVIISGLIGVAEWRVRHVLWAGHLPSFLEMDPLVAHELTPVFRNYSAIYRVQSVFSTAIGFGEFITLATPFVLNYGLSKARTLLGMAALATVPFLVFVAYITNARSALVGLLVGGAAYGFYWGYTRYRQDRQSLTGRAMVLGYPVMMALGFAATLVVGHIRKAVWGGGEAASSTISRTVQYQHGIPLVLKRPWGYGIGQGADVLGYHQPGGMLTIDTYYLLIALEYGVLGFILFYGMLLAGLWGAGRNALRDPGDDKECSYLGAAGASLLAFLVIKSVFAEANNHPLVYMMLGMVCALSARVRRQIATQSPATARSMIDPVRVRPSRPSRALGGA